MGWLKDAWDWTKGAAGTVADVAVPVATGGFVPPPTTWGGGGGGAPGGPNQISGPNQGRGGPQLMDPAAAAGWDYSMGYGENALAQGGVAGFGAPRNDGGGGQGGEGNWMNLRNPGAGETWADENAGFFTDPTNSGQYWNQVAGKFNAPGGGTNRADQWYNQFQGQVPDLPADAGLSGYYDDAKRRTSEDVNSQLAARGVFGSSEGVGMLNEALTGLEAERSNREADYRLATAAEDRAWQGLGGDLARGADLTELEMSGNELDWLTGGADVAGLADRNDLARRLGGADVAFRSQDAREGRVGDAFDRTYGFGADTRDFLQGGYETGFAQDERLLGDALEAYLGKYGFDYSEGERKEASNNAGLAMFLDFFSNFGGMGG